MKPIQVRAATATLASAVLVPVLSFAGDLERYCPNGGAEVTEKWSASNLPVSWVLVTSPTGTNAVPGLVANSVKTCDPSIPVEELPGFQSILEAAAAWRNMPFKTDPCPGLSFQLNPPPQQSLFEMDTVLLTQAANLNPTQFGNIFGGDMINHVSFWEPPATFLPLGGSIVMAFSDVQPILATGEIIEADVAVNAMSIDSATNRAHFRWVEWNDLTGQMHASLAWGANADDPVLGYGDIRGVLTHEIGHLAGLGHSVLDGEADGTSSRFPTMFHDAQVVPFAGQIADTYDCPTSTWTTVSVDGANTVAGGILGKSARTLEPDDVAAIGRGYPTSFFNSAYGQIHGNVYQLSGATTVPLLGASVVAVLAECPEYVRVGTLSYTDGAFTLHGLPAGDYYVYVEPIDQSPVSGLDNGYFPWSVVPNYVYQLPTSFSGCAGPTPFVREFYDSSETFVETSAANATLVTVNRGVVTPGIDFYVTDVTEAKLTASNPFATPPVPPSTRGVITTDAQLGGVVLKVEGTGPNYPVAVYLNQSLSYQMISGQLVEVGIQSGSGIPTVVNGSLDPTSHDFIVSFGPYGGMHAFENIFAQAGILTPNGPRFSNVVNVWAKYP